MSVSLVRVTMLRRLVVAPLAQTRSISWGPRFNRNPTSTPKTIQKNTLYKPTRPRSENTHAAALVPKGSRSTQPKDYPPRPAQRPTPTPLQYVAHKARMKKMFPEGWAPPRTISREAMEALRDMHARDPVRFRTPVLAAKFKISPEAVSRILKSKWQPSPERKAKMIMRENKEKDMAIAERIRIEREEVQRSLKGRPVLLEAGRTEPS